MLQRKTRVLIVDDDPAMREVLRIRLDEWGFGVRVAGDGGEAVEVEESWNPDVVITDVIMPDRSGIDLLKSLKKGDPTRPVILITAATRIDAAVEAMKQGAQDFLTKPLDYSKLQALLEEAEHDLELRARARKLSSRLEKGTGFGGFVGTSRAMRDAYELIENVAGSDASVIITGESGTGKELVAKTIHDLSARSSKPFIAINAAAIPETLLESEVFGHDRGAFTGAIATRAGCFEMANTGTLFLDEIVEMPVAMQPKLLRVLENGKIRKLGGDREFSFDVRVLAATNREPRRAVAEGRLREDLYYRLNVFTITLPPLRERREDIPLLAQSFIGEFNLKHSRKVETLRDDALDLLSSYAWPGNVRELRNVMERAIVLAKGSWIDSGCLPPYMRDGESQGMKKIVLPMGISMADAEKELISKTLEQTENNKAEAARRLGVDVKTIRNKLKSYGID